LDASAAADGHDNERITSGTISPRRPKPGGNARLISMLRRQDSFPGGRVTTQNIFAVVLSKIMCGLGFSPGIERRWMIVIPHFLLQDDGFIMLSNRG